MQENNQSKLFYTLMCLAGFFILLFPVGIANLVLGYMMGDSPCSSCWGQRQSMIFIGLMALFIVRYGIKPRYIAMILIMTAFGLWQSFNHLAWHAGRDLDQGFSLMIFGLHTYFWAEVVFWAVVLLLGVIFIFISKFSQVEIEGKFREFTKPVKYAFLISAFVIASNAFQAFVSTGIPPYMGQGDPVRFTLNPNNIIWSAKNWSKVWSSFSVLGKRDVKDPDFAFAPATKIGVEFDNNSANSPFSKIDKTLKITNEQKIDIPAVLNTLSFINGEYVVSSKYDVYFLDSKFKTLDSFEIDPYFSATINPIVGIIPYLNNKYMLMGSNKTFLRFAKNPNANEHLQYADFIKGANHFEGQGEGLGRGRLETIRAKFHHAISIATDGKYIYTATVPNNKDKKTFVISKFLASDRTLSAEFTPEASLANGKTLGDLYITAMTYHNNTLYALSKNHNVIVAIDPKNEKVTAVWSFPAEISNARAISFDSKGALQILSYQNNSNLLFTLQ